MIGVLVNERCNLVRVLDPVREGRSNKLALNLIFSVKAYKILQKLMSGSNSGSVLFQQRQLCSFFFKL